MMRLLQTRTMPVGGPLLKRMLTAASNPPLPALPLPKLADTMNKLLTTIEPHVTKDGYQRSKSAIEKFLAPGGDGAKLQKLLEERASGRKNWLSDWWLQSAYLQYRDPVIIYSSPGLVFPKLKYVKVDDQLKYAAKITFGALLYKRMIDQGQIPADKMGKAPLDMSQYNKIFGTCRVPGMPEDSVQYNPDSTHIVVASNNQYFKVEVGSSENIVGEEALHKMLRQCHEMSQQKAEPVGMLSPLCSIKKYTFSGGIKDKSWQHHRSNQSSRSITASHQHVWSGNFWKGRQITFPDYNLLAIAPEDLPWLYNSFERELHAKSCMQEVATNHPVQTSIDVPGIGSNSYKHRKALKRGPFIYADPNGLNLTTLPTTLVTRPTHTSSHRNRQSFVFATFVQNSNWNRRTNITLQLREDCDQPVQSLDNVCGRRC